ncbi:coiled-coil domain-containing protein 50 [Xiphophorus maculatus]|uniref:Coiled-coil domain containing 50a n=1 Tax=Xiphophorus maculatus TaxID=8083 RepID=M4AV93_XIPMA|nr:coiled-coil domain-containing protein 50 [Xiphophorus maculatus]
MAECNVSIDQKKLPGVKEVCKDFAVLEDHSLAYNLQEQEIESHLASNVHKSRLVQKDLQVAKKLQEEEDEMAKIQNQKQNSDIERQDVEIAHEIQEELVRQAEQQRQQEEKDAAIARKLHEKEMMKEERRRQKQMEAKYEEDYFEDHGEPRSADVDKRTRQTSRSPDLHDSYSPSRSNRKHSPDYYSAEAKRSRHPKQDSAALRGHSRYPEHYMEAERGRSKHADPCPEHLLPSRGKHGDSYPEFEPSYTGRAREQGQMEDGVMRRKEKPARPPPPHTTVERDKDREKDRQRHDRDRDYKTERHIEEYTRGREQDARQRREREKSRDRIPSDDGPRDGDRHRQKDRQQTRSRDRALDLDFLESEYIRDRPRDKRGSWEEEEDDGGRKARSRQLIHSSPVEVFDVLTNSEARGGTREIRDLLQVESPGTERSHSQPSRETGHVDKGSGSVIPETEYGLTEATKGLTNLDLREQELKDMEVARRLQEEELKRMSNMKERAAQVAKDEEIARSLMEKEKKEYRKNREREKEKERERMAMEKMAVERKRPEGNYKPSSEEAAWPRSRDEYEYHRQRNNNRPVRPPQPRTPDYENVSSVYVYSDHHAASRPPQRPEATYRGAYQKR